MRQFEDLLASVNELKAMVAAAAAGTADVQQEEQEPEEEDEEIELFTPGMTYEEKYNVVKSHLPINSNNEFSAVIADVDGSKCLLWALQLELNKAVAEEGASYDTASASSALASKVLHTLFTIDYVKRFKLYDARDNYVQTAGTAMGENVYEWIKAAMVAIADEFYQNFQMATRFDWAKFYSKLREVWRWTRSNNSDNRKIRRRNKRKDIN